MRQLQKKYTKHSKEQKNKYELLYKDYELFKKLETNIQTYEDKIETLSKKMREA